MHASSPARPRRPEASLRRAARGAPAALRRVTERDATRGLLERHYPADRELAFG
jgi:hypothetical protein